MFQWRKVPENTGPEMAEASGPKEFLQATASEEDQPVALNALNPNISLVSFAERYPPHKKPLLSH
jgi:hypothetical protein